MNADRMKRVLRASVLGLLVFGTWAFVVNFAYPDHRLKSAVSQGLFSFFFSIVVMSITEAVYVLLAGRRWQVLLAIVVPVATSIGCAALIHLAAHTPSIAMTLLGPAVIGSAYQTIYVRGLRRGQRRSCEAARDEPDRDRPAGVQARSRTLRLPD